MTPSAPSIGSGELAARSRGSVSAETGAEAVLDITVPVAHHPVTLEALRAGLPVLGEKPAAQTVAEALALAAAQIPQAVGLFGGLDTFGGHAEAEGSRQRNDRFHDGIALGLLRQARDEGAVDLQYVDRESAEVGKRGVAGAEIVDGKAHAERGQGA